MGVKYYRFGDFFDRGAGKKRRVKERECDDKDDNVANGEKLADHSG